MALYDWRGRNNRGEAVNGQLEAMTEGGVADQLRSMGVAPVYIGVAKVPETWLISPTGLVVQRFTGQITAQLLGEAIQAMTSGGAS